MSTFRLRTEIEHGENALAALDGLSELRVLVVTDPFMAASPWFTEVRKHLGENVEVFSQVEPNPSTRVIARATKSLVAFAPDAIVALGGGSCIDTAKATLKVARDHEIQVSHGLWVVPTTSGSGSEVTSFAVVTEETQHVKVPLVSRDMVPEVAILDARSVLTAPPSITADTGMDVCTHAVEAYLSSNSSDFSDALAEKAIQLVCGALSTCYRRGDDLAARQRMHNASCMAGMAFDNAGLGITHSLAHALGGQFAIPHGRLNAMLLPHTLAWNASADTSGRTAARIAWLGHLVGSGGQTQRQQVNSFIQAIRQLTRELQIPARITTPGLDRQAFRDLVPSMAQAALADECTNTNPVPPGQADLEKILLALV